MVSLSVFLLVNLVAEAVTLGTHVRGTVGESVVLPCDLNTSTAIDPGRLRFHWQGTADPSVLYSFDKGRETPQYQSATYRSRSTASLSDMRRGIISVRLNNLTLEDDQKSFSAYVVLDVKGRLDRICPTTLHVAVPYENPNLTLNEEMMLAVCTSQGGFPEPVVTWQVQELPGNTNHVLQPVEANTTAVQHLQDRLFTVTSSINTSGGKYHSVTCLIHNPTSNVTLNVTIELSEREKQAPLSWVPVVAVVVGVLIAACAAAICIYKRCRGPPEDPAPCRPGSNQDKLNGTMSNGTNLAMLSKMQEDSPTGNAASATSDNATARTSDNAKEEESLINKSVNFDEGNGENLTV
ncbi:T-lymphocyte activation antigen CD80-like [Myripristis murdjan]|uniref:T-lymphocyte activation antigen CD80-like n=1 Tax=Myripristis murdjan TaxID=586833 RepID=UPI001175D7B6|nr:T-lymphocyte activation antigen CD80-like [Myripristis murdjan]XP_029936958.1 T-lymphocyte activation antigen CD80-like [Myripristis murdjan]